MLTQLKLPDNVLKAVRHTRMDGRVLGMDTRREYVGNGEQVSVGLELTKNNDNNYNIVIWVVEESYHVCWSILTLTKDGQLIEGSVCQFGLVLGIDQDWVNVLLNDLNHDIIEWDEIK